MENRQLQGYDTSLPGPGLLVFLVDDAVDGNDNEWHPQVKLLQVRGRGVRECIIRVALRPTCGSLRVRGGGGNRESGREGDRAREGRD